MSVGTLNVKKTPQKIKEDDIGIVPIFEIFVDDYFGTGVWQNMMEIEEFSEMMVNYYPRYGDAVFKELVDIVTNEKEISHVLLLKEFGEFFRTYY